eukprot:2787298-Pyramimonas_sp.AAC.1
MSPQRSCTGGTRIRVPNSTSVPTRLKAPPSHQAPAAQGEEMPAQTVQPPRTAYRASRRCSST